MKMHIHIYKVLGKAEKDFPADTPAKEAKAKALQEAKEGKLDFNKSDCEFIAMDFKC